MKIKLTRSQKVKLANSSRVFDIMKEVLKRETYLDLTKEHFWIVCLANNNMLLLIELVSFGSSKATIVEPTEVFSFALQKKASKLIMVHNHPSGELTPSFKDKELTERMAAIGKFVRVPVVDHLIITNKKYFSFTDSGLLDEIMAESHYDLTFSQIDKLKEQMAFVARKAAVTIKLKDEKLKMEESARKRAEKKSKKMEEKLKKEIEQLKKQLTLKKRK